MRPVKVLQVLDSPDVLRQLHLVNVMALERRERELPARLREVFRMGTGRTIPTAPVAHNKSSHAMPPVIR